MRKAPKTVDSYIASFPKEVQTMMKQLRAAIKASANDVTEKISYGIPFYEYKYPGYKGRLVYFRAFKKHVSIFAWGREVDKYKELKKYKTSKGTLQFPIGTKIPVTLVKKVVRARMREIDRSLKSEVKKRGKKNS